MPCRQARSPAHPASPSMNTGPQRKHAAKIALQSKDWRAILFDFFFSTGPPRPRRPSPGGPPGRSAPWARCRWSGWRPAQTGRRSSCRRPRPLFTLDVPVRRDYVLADGYLYGMSSGTLLRTERTYVPFTVSGNSSEATRLQITLPTAIWPARLSPRLSADISTG